jgi:hypothetical protein
MPTLVLVGGAGRAGGRESLSLGQRLGRPARGAAFGALVGPLACLTVSLLFFASGKFGLGFLRLSVVAGLVLGATVGPLAAGFRLRWGWAGVVGGFLACSTFLLLVARYYAIGLLQGSLAAVSGEFALGVVIALAWGFAAAGLPVLADGAVRRWAEER